MIKIYEEPEGHVEKTLPSFTALYPTNFEKQKVSLAQNILHEKTKAALLHSTTCQEQQDFCCWSFIICETI